MHLHNRATSGPTASIRGARRSSVAFCAVGLLLAVPGFGQSYSPLYAPSSDTTLYDYCYDDQGYVVANCEISITTGYYAGTNEHTHYSIPPPVSTITPSSGYTNSSGYLQVTLATTIVGQAEYAESCTYYTCTVFQYAVGVAGIYWVSDHGIWTQNGATPIHGNSVAYNHWMTSNSAYEYYYTTVAYQQTYPGLVFVERHVASLWGKV